MTRARAIKKTSSGTSIVVRPEPSAAIQAMVQPPKVTATDVFRSTLRVAEKHQEAVGMVSAATDALLVTVNQTNVAAAKHLAAAAG